MASGYFNYLRDLLKERTGLVVTPDKMYLVETRLMPVARRVGYMSIEDMLIALQKRHDEKLIVEVTEAMNTHESLFFRDQDPFDLFEKVILPKLLESRASQKRFRIWCAACSSGQEPYSLSMLLDQHAAKLTGWRTEIIATDISHSVLDRAREGLYSQFEVQRGLPVQLMIKYFSQEGEYWRLKPDIRKKVTFRHFNLLDDPKGLGKFDLIFCRNVLIYFDVDTKKKVLRSVRDVLRDDGVLFLGSAESTMGLSEDLWPVEAGRGVYKHTKSPTSIADQ